MLSSKIITPTAILLALTAVGAAKAVIVAPQVYTVAETHLSTENEQIDRYGLQTETEESAKEEEVAAPEPLVCEPDETMLQIVKQERDLLEVQKEKSAAETAELELLREKLSVEQARLDELKTEITSLLRKVDQAQTDDLKSLITLYSSMKPQEAASIMNDLDLEVTVMVLAGMSERAAAPVLAKMNPVRARAISKIIFERSKLPGDQNLIGLKLK